MLSERILRELLARRPPRDPDDDRSVGQRASDAIARFGGSWTFIGLFAVFMLVWAVLNTEILGPRKEAFDPYPYVFLNLVLSMLAALQAPIIMMSQNRQAERDRIEARQDYETNLRAEAMIRGVEEQVRRLHDTLLAPGGSPRRPPDAAASPGHDAWAELLELQRRQLALLARLAAEARPGAP